MKKKALQRGALGFPLGITIGYVITVGISLAFGQGFYIPCAPELIRDVGTEIGAVVLQACLCGLLGTVSGASSIIWEIERWSLAKQTLTFFLSLAVPMGFIAYFLRWMDHSVSGMAGYFGIFLLIFVMDWVLQYFVNKHNVQKMNSKLNENEFS